LFKALNGLIGALGVQVKIQLLGWKDREEVSALMDEADIYLGPSVTGKGATRRVFLLF